MLKVNFKDDEIEKSSGHIICIWLNTGIFPYHESSIKICKESVLAVDFLLDFQNLLKPADVILFPAGFIDYNLILCLEYCEKSDYPLLFRNLFQSIKLYKDEGNLCKNFSLYLIPGLDEDFFYKCLYDYENFFDEEIEINFYGNK